MMSIRPVLLGTRLVNTGIAVFLIGTLGVYSIRQSVEKETQDRVTHDLGIVSSYLQNHLELLAQSIEQIAGTSSLSNSELHAQMHILRQEINATILNLCDINSEGVRE